MRTQGVSFRNPSGQRLAALLDLPSGNDPTACALFAHCFTCSKDYKGVVHVSRALAREGMAVLRFDFTGLGESEGDFSDTSFSSNVDDLVAAAEFLAREWTAPKVLVGHSLGGAAVLQASARIPSSLAVATIGAPSDLAHLANLLRSSRAEVEATGEAAVRIAGRTFRIRRDFFEDLESVNMYRVIEGLGCPLMIFHSPRDSIVGIEHASTIFRAARHPKSFVSLDTADHMLSDAEDAGYVGAVLAAWSHRYAVTT